MCQSIQPRFWDLQVFCLFNVFPSIRRQAWGPVVWNSRPYTATVLRLWAYPRGSRSHLVLVTSAMVHFCRTIRININSDEMQTYWDCLWMYQLISKELLLGPPTAQLINGKKHRWSQRDGTSWRVFSTANGPKPGIVKMWSQQQPLLPSVYIYL